MSPESTKARKYTLFPIVLFCAVWFIPVAMTLLQYDVGVVSYAVLFAGGVTAGAIMLEQKHVLVGMPFLALLAPTGGLYELLGFSVSLTDWIIIVLSAPPLYRIALGKSLFQRGYHKLTSSYLLVLSCVFIFSLSFNILLGNLESLSAIYYLWCYFLIYYYFQRHCFGSEEWSSILLAWIISASLASVILIDAFFRGILLINFSIDPEQIKDTQSMQDLFRASYYYPGLHFIVGALASALFVWIFLCKERFFITVMALVAFLLMVAALVVMVNKTAIFAAFGTVILMLLLFARRYSAEHFFWMVVVLAISSLFISSGLQLFFPDLELFDARMGTHGTFFVRTQVWLSALNEFFQRPSAILFGMGPQFIESGSQDIASLFKSAYDTGGLEGALDSTWLTVLVELGIVGFVIVVLVFRLALRRLNCVERYSQIHATNKSVFLIVYASLLFLMFAFTTQAIGYAKVSWFAFTILLISLSYRPWPWPADNKRS
jgi:hypothetical protein